MSKFRLTFRTCYPPVLRTKRLSAFRTDSPDMDRRWNGGWADFSPEWFHGENRRVPVFVVVIFRVYIVREFCLAARTFQPTERRQSAIRQFPARCWGLLYLISRERY